MSSEGTVCPERVLRSGPRGRARLGFSRPRTQSNAVINFMFIIKKILEAFILPPGTVVTALVLIALYLRKRSRSGAVMCAALALVCWAGATRVVSKAVLRPLEQAYSVPAKPEGDVIVLLCGGAGDVPIEITAAAALYPATMQRTYAVARLQKKTGLPVIISGGAPFSETPESVAAARYLAELGVPTDKIITEEASRDTFENAAYTLKICKEKGYKRIILVTSGYHMPRSVYLFKKAGFESVQAYPYGHLAPASRRRHLRDYLPGDSSDLSRAFNEYFGLLTYMLYYLAHR